MRQVYLRTSDIFNNDKIGREMFDRYFSIASKYGLVKSTVNNSKDLKIILYLEGSRLNFLKYYLETLIHVETHKIQGLKRLIYFLY